MQIKNEFTQKYFMHIEKLYSTFRDFTLISRNGIVNRRKPIYTIVCTYLKG